MPFDPITAADEWTSEKIKAVVVAELRRLYVRTRDMLQEAERANAEGRTAGMSYGERKVYTAKIDLALEMLKELNNRGRYAKSLTFAVKDFLDEDSLSLIERLGFEGYLQFLVQRGYPQQPPIALSQVKGYTTNVSNKS